MNTDYAKSAKLKTVGMVLSIVLDIVLIVLCCYFAYLNASFIIRGEETVSKILYLIVYTIQILATILWIKSLVRDIKELKAFDPVEYAAKLEQEDKEIMEERERAIQEAIIKARVDRMLKEENK